MALSMTLCLNSAQTEINRCCFCKVVWRHYLGEVGKFLSYFMSNLSKTLRINFYQKRSSIVEVMIKNGVFFMPHSVYLKNFAAAAQLKMANDKCFRH